MDRKRGLLSAHVAVLLFALSGVIAKLVDQSAVVLSSARSLIAAAALLLLLLIVKGLHRMRFRSFMVLLLSGGILALHWVAFYTSIKVSTVSIGVVAVSTFPIMTALIEPLVSKEPWRWVNVLYASLVMLGTVILLGFSPSSSDLNGLAWGFGAAALFVCVHLINKYQVTGIGDNRPIDGRQLSLIQLATAGLVLLPFASQGIDVASPTWDRDIWLTLFLGVASTAMAYALYISSMKSLSASTAAIVTGLEPIYAIGISVLFLHERMEWSMLIGAAIILFAVVRSSMVEPEQAK